MRQIGGEIRELEKDPEMEGRESEMSRRNRDIGQTVRERQTHERGTQRKEEAGEGLREKERTQIIAGVKNEWSRQKQRQEDSCLFPPHTLVISLQTYPWKQTSRKKYYQVTFVNLLKDKRKMAKERGQISPSDFAQLQKYMECESSSQSSSLAALPQRIPAPHPHLPQFPQQPKASHRHGKGGRERWGDICGLNFPLAFSEP